MADNNDRIPVTYSLDAKSGEITRIKGKGDDVIERKVVAHYNAETQTVTLPNKNFMRLYQQAVTTFLAENELGIRSFQRGDMKPDEPLSKKVTPRPKKDKFNGDKTEAVVQWYFDHRPNEFATRYKVLGRYSGLVHIYKPIWEPRPLDGILEYRGAEKWEKEVVNVIVADRKTHLTYTPEECLGWTDDDEEDAESAMSGSAKTEEGEE